MDVKTASLIGAGLAIVLGRIGTRLPRVPAGDVGAAIVPLEDAGIAAGRMFDSIDAFARRWSVSGITLLVVSLVLGWALRAVF